jgi:hypothetical protein
MRLARAAVPLLLLLTLPVFAPARANADDPPLRPNDGRHTRVRDFEEGRAFCPHRHVVVGNVVVPGGRCYTVGVLRNDRGTFLAFLDPDVRLRHGPEPLEGREWHRIRERIEFLARVPRDMRVGHIPMNTIQLIRFREEDEVEGDGDRERIRDSRLVIVVPGEPERPDVTGTIVIHF